MLRLRTSEGSSFLNAERSRLRDRLAAGDALQFAVSVARSCGRSPHRDAGVVMTTYEHGANYSGTRSVPPSLHDLLPQPAHDKAP